MTEKQEDKSVASEEKVEETQTPEETKEEVKEEPKTEEKKEEAPAEEKPEVKEEEGVNVEVPKKFEALVKQIEEMPVLELNELVKLLEKKFGVSAAAVAVAGNGGDAGVTEEQDSFDVELTSDGGAKIPVMKAVKELLGLGLKEAKDMVEALPASLKTGVKKEEAEEIKKKIEEAGGQVNLK